MLFSFKKLTIHTLSTFVFQHRIMESRPAEYNRPVCWSSWSAFTPDLWRGSSSSLITNDMVTFRLGMAWLWGWPWEWPEDGRIPAAILHLSTCHNFHYQISPFSVKLRAGRACFALFLARFSSFVPSVPSHVSKIQLVVYYQCSVLIGWATSRLFFIAH